MNKAVLLSLGNVKSFRGYNVASGVVHITDEDVIQHLDSTYDEVVICNYNVKPGGALHQLAPIMFQEVKGQYLEELQLSLQSQLAQGNDVDIEFYQ